LTAFACSFASTESFVVASRKPSLGFAVRVPAGSLEPRFVEPVVAKDPIRRTSTWGGGSGVTFIYGVAAPLKTPLLGQVRKQ